MGDHPADVDGFVPAGAARIFGPEGFTLDARAILEPYVLPIVHGGLMSFAGVPSQAAVQALRSLRSGPEYLADEVSKVVVAAASDCNVGRVTVAGIIVGAERHDERVEFREVHVTFDETPDRRQMDEAAARLASHDLEVTFDHFPDGYRITGVAPLPH